MAKPVHSASEALHKLEEQLTCPICLDQYTDPKILPCFHSFCLKCLNSVPLELIRQPQNNHSYSLPCPTCKSSCPLSPKGIDALPSSITINNLTEVYNLLKKSSGNPQAVNDMCKIESTTLQPLNQQINRLAEAVAELVRRRKEIEDEGSQVKKKLHDKIAQIKKLLDLTEKKLDEEINEILKGKLDVTDHQTKDAEEVLGQLTECKDHIQQSLEVAGTLQNKEASYAENLVARVANKPILPTEKAHIEQVKRHELDEIITKIGKILYSTSVTSSYQQIPLIDQQSTISISLHSIIQMVHLNLSLPLA